MDWQWLALDSLPDLPILALLLLLAVVAGWVDAVAGGGGLLVTPVLLSIGLTPLQALATNKLQGSFGTLTAMLSFMRSGLLHPMAHMPLVALALLGSMLGVFSVSLLQTAWLNALIPLLLMAFAVYFMLAPSLSDEDRAVKRRSGLFALAVGLIGFYDGFFGPGAGSFLVMACVMLLGLGLKRATATTKLLNFASNIAALLIFAMLGEVMWLLGLMMGCGQVIGSALGARMAIRHGQHLIRPVLVVVTLLISIKLLLND